MKIHRYGIVLESLRPDDLEMVRLWRNQAFIRSNMEFTQIITREAQENWYHQLDEESNLYWIIRTHNYPIGLIHIKNIDWHTITGEAGVFIGEPSYLEMPQPMLAILLMMELAFKALSFNTLRAKIRSGNKRAVDFNMRLGYQLVPDQPEGFQYYQVNRGNFEIATKKLRERARHMYGGQTIVENSEVKTKLATKLIAGIQDSESEFNPVFP